MRFSKPLYSPHQVHVVEARFHSRQAANGPYGGVQVQGFAKLHVDRREAFADRRGTGTFQGYSGVADGFDRRFRQHVRAGFQCGQAGQMFFPDQRRFRCRQHLADGHADFRSNAVSRNQHDSMIVHGFSCDRALSSGEGDPSTFSATSSMLVTG
jgi:hypothetical protein